MNTFPPFVLFSASLADHTDSDNRGRTNLMAGALTHRGIKFMRVMGHYNGKAEESFLVFAHDGSHAAITIERLAHLYAQESVLYVDANRYAYLYMLSSDTIRELGKWQEVQSVRPFENYTVIDGRYYVAT